MTGTGAAPLLVALGLLSCAASAGAQASPSPDPEPTPSPPRLILAGEVGARLELIRNGAFGAGDDRHRFRQRLRLRFGGQFRASEHVFAGFRLTTGDESFPPSAWQTLSSDLKRPSIRVDRAWVGVRSGVGELRAGLMANPIFAPTEVVWDSDVQPAGLGETLPLGGSGLTLAAGQFWLREARSGRPESEEGSMLLAQSLSWAHENTGRTVAVGLSYWHYNKPDTLARAIQTGSLSGAFRTNRFNPLGPTGPPADGTTPVRPATYFSGYGILGGGLQVGGRGRRAFTLSAEATVNLRARSDPALGEAYAHPERWAFATMLRYGASRRPWDWTVGVGYAHIEADAVIAVYNSDDLQQTNVRAVPLLAILLLPGGPRLVADAYIQKKLNPAIPGPAGVPQPENSPRIKARISLMVGF